MPSPSFGPPVNEEMVSRLWTEQRFRREDLRVVGGETLQVVHRGWATDGRGPDFREAIIALGRELRHGDVEIHLRSSDWFLHGHHCDPYYNQVILHVVLWHDTAKPMVVAAGRTVPVLELCHYLATPFEDLVADLTAFAPPRNPCHGLGGSEPATLTTILQQAGEERFRQKAARFAQALAVYRREQVLYAGILEAMGYSKNRDPCRQLAEGLPLDILEGMLWGKQGERRDLCAQAILLGAAGLLPSQRTSSSMEDGDSYPSALEEAWRAFGGERVVNEEWHFFRIRPENYPPRRVAGAALLFARHLEEGLEDRLAKALSGKDEGHARRQLEAALMVPAPRYWHFRRDFGAPSAVPLGALIGRERAAVTAINIVLPYFYGLADGRRAPLAERALALYQTYPRLASNAVTRAMERQLSLDAMVRGLGALHQQGLLHLHQTCCNRGICSSCECAIAHSQASELLRA